MARASQRDETAIRCPCDRVAKYQVGEDVACTLHVANLLRNVLLGEPGTGKAGATSVEVTSVDGQLS